MEANLTRLKSALVKSALIGLGAASVIAATASTASAYVACNRFGECWRVYNHYDYPTTLGIVIHDDDWWAGHPAGHWHWRGPRDDHGYYDHGAWRTG
jgi:hypothetical protein